MPKVHIETWGCQMNTADAEAMLALLVKADYALVGTADEADLVLLNTCHIREKARHKVLSRLGELRIMKEKNPGMRIAVAGCVAQAEGKKLVEAAPQIDVLFGPGKIKELPRLLRENAATRKSAIAVGFGKGGEQRRESEHEAEPGHEGTPRFEAGPGHEGAPSFEAGLGHETAPGFEGEAGHEAELRFKAGPIPKVELRHRAGPEHETEPGQGAGPRHGAACRDPDDRDVDGVGGHERVVMAPPALSGINDVSRYVNIQQGCNNYCTFCVVPFTRGREVSRPPGEILAECKALLATGARELTVLGQNVNSYGLDLTADGRLAVTADGAFVDLLKAVCALSGLARLRFTTSNPQNFSPALAALFRDEPKLGKYIHLPVQAGNDRTLERMKRKVTATEYRERLAWLREAAPDMAISTDLIVGFPGETEAEFEETLKLVEEVRFSFSFTFKYSPRKNTPANRYVDQVPEDVKEARLARLNALQERITIEENAKEVGRTREVLFLYQNRRFPTQYYGRTDHFRLVRVDCGRDVVGQVLPVRIEASTKTSLVGTLA